MKYLLAALAISLGLTASVSAQTAGNSPEVHPAVGAERARQNAIVAQAIKSHRNVLFITSYTPTGSHIKQVVGYYNGRFYPVNNVLPGNVYSGRALDASGALDVGSALASLDPAITTFRIGR